MVTIAVIAQRGGVGKSTTAHAIGRGLIKDYSAKVLFVDLDAQGNLSRSMEADNSGISGADVLAALTGRATTEAAIQHTPQGDILASTPALSGADTRESIFSASNPKGRVYCLKKALEAVSGAYDYAVIDTPPALSIITVNALTACNKVIIPVQAEIFSLEALSRLRDTIETVKASCNPALQVDGILLTRYNGRAVISRDIAEMIEAEAPALKTRVYNTRIRECTAIKEAQALKQDIYTYAPRSNAAKDYRALLTEIIGG